MPPLPCPPPRGHSPRSWHNVPPPLGSLCLSLMPLLRCCVLASLDLHPSGPHPHLTWAGCHAAPSQARPTSPHCKVWRPGLVVPRLPTRRRDGVGYPSPGPGPPSVHLDFRPLILPPRPPGQQHPSQCCVLTPTLSLPPPHVPSVKGKPARPGEAQCPPKEPQPAWVPGIGNGGVCSSARLPAPSRHLVPAAVLPWQPGMALKEDAGEKEHERGSEGESRAEMPAMAAAASAQEGGGCCKSCRWRR